MPDPLPDSQLLIYRTEDGRIKLDVRFEHETVWLTQPMMADLFDTTVPNVSMHLRNIFEEGELEPKATVKKFLTVRQEGSRKVTRSLEYYNLDAIITINDRDILTHAGRVTHELALAHAGNEYEQYNRKRLAEAAVTEDDFDQAVKVLPAPPAKPAGKRPRKKPKA